MQSQMHRKEMGVKKNRFYAIPSAMDLYHAQ